MEKGTAADTMHWDYSKVLEERRRGADLIVLLMRDRDIIL